MNKNRNQTFQYLEALAILMVIDDHAASSIGIFSNIFPYNSFYMPMFVFISGYFFKPQGILQNVEHKTRHLLIPYLIWAVVGEIISYILQAAGIVSWYVSPFSLRSVFQLFFVDSLSTITGASWFVIMLFWVSIVYNILYHILRLDRKTNSYIFLLISVIAGIVALSFCRAYYAAKKLYYCFILRTVWYLQFYNMGVMFHKYWEASVKKWRPLYICVLCVLINVIIICAVGDRIEFKDTAKMNQFKSSLLPLVTSITGTLFWYKIMDYISPKIGRIKAVDFLAEHTFTIMESHLLFINLPNFYIYYQYLHNNPKFANFDASEFVSWAWCRYSDNSTLISFFCGLFGSIAVALLLDYLKRSFSRKKLCTAMQI